MCCEGSGFKGRPYNLIGTFPQQATNFIVVNTNTNVFCFCLFFRTEKTDLEKWVEANSCGACPLPLNFLCQGSDFGFSIP